MTNTTTAPADMIYGHPRWATHIDYSNIPVFKQPTLEEQITTLRKEINELRQELTVIKTLLPAPIYNYSVTNASE